MKERFGGVKGLVALEQFDWTNAS